jgi:hypothetical protein
VRQIGAVGLLALVLVVRHGHELRAALVALQRGRLRHSLHLLLLLYGGWHTAARPLIVVKLLLLPVPSLVLE